MDASALLSELLLNAEGYYDSIDPLSLEAFRQEFVRRNNTSVDVDALVSRHWLRNVLGRIRIAGKISYDLMEYKNVQPFLAELTFLLATERKYKLPEQNAQTDQVDHVIPWQSDQVFYWQNN